MYLPLEFKLLRSQPWNQAIILTAVILLATSALRSFVLLASHAKWYGFVLRLFQKRQPTRSWLNTTSSFWSGYEVFFTIKLSSYSFKSSLPYLDDISLVKISNSRQQSRGTCGLSTCQDIPCLLWNKSPPVDPNQARWIHSTSSCQIFKIHLNIFLSLTVQSLSFRISTHPFLQYAFLISSICAIWTARGIYLHIRSFISDAFILPTLTAYKIANGEPRDTNCKQDRKRWAPCRPRDDHWSDFHNTQVRFTRLRKEVLYRIPWKYDKWFGHWY